jgi:hypothetical protein
MYLPAHRLLIRKVQLVLRSGLDSTSRCFCQTVLAWCMPYPGVSPPFDLGHLHDDACHESARAPAPVKGACRFRTLLCLLLFVFDVLLLYRGEKHPMQFGREMLAKLVGAQHRADWRQCKADSAAAEEALTQKFSGFYSKYSPNKAE